ncbi:MAG: hypothetical protein AAFS07_16415 [Pseudomonadota bacterium]
MVERTKAVLQQADAGDRGSDIFWPLATFCGAIAGGFAFSALTYPWAVFVFGKIHLLILGLLGCFIVAICLLQRMPAISPSRAAGALAIIAMALSVVNVARHTLQDVPKPAVERKGPFGLAPNVG